MNIAYLMMTDRISGSGTSLTSVEHDRVAYRPLESEGRVFLNSIDSSYHSSYCEYDIGLLSSYPMNQKVWRYQSRCSRFYHWYDWWYISFSSFGDDCIALCRCLLGRILY